VQGFEVIYRTLTKMFLTDAALTTITHFTQPLSPEYVVRKVLVPEAAACLIAEDLSTSITDPQVYKTLEDSRPYGAAMFPDTDALH